MFSHLSANCCYGYVGITLVTPRSIGHHSCFAFGKIQVHMWAQRPAIPTFIFCGFPQSLPADTGVVSTLKYATCQSHINSIICWWACEISLNHASGGWFCELCFELWQPVQTASLDAVALRSVYGLLWNRKHDIDCLSCRQNGSLFVGRGWVPWSNSGSWRAYFRRRRLRELFLCVVLDRDKYSALRYFTFWTIWRLHVHCDLWAFPSSLFNIIVIISAERQTEKASPWIKHSLCHVTVVWSPVGLGQRAESLNCETSSFPVKVALGSWRKACVSLHNFSRVQTQDRGNQRQFRTAFF